MLLKFLGFFLVVTLVVAEMPSYIKVCGRRNPELSRCAWNSTELLREKLRTGMPEIDVPSLEPLKLGGFPILDTDQLTTYANNVEIRGITNFDIKDSRIDLKEKSLTMDVIFEELIIDADYDVTARIIVPIQGKGPLHLTAINIRTLIAMKWKYFTKNDKQYMHMYTMMTKLAMKDYKADFKTSNNDETLQQAISATINGERQEFIKIVTPTLEKLISREVLRLTNLVCHRFSFDEFFPDRE